VLLALLHLLLPAATPALTATTTAAAAAALFRFATQHADSAAGSLLRRLFSDFPLADRS
jgi:hypothetical protein